jgi:signal transduction histidine kinase
VRVSTKLWSGYGLLLLLLGSLLVYHVSIIRDLADAQRRVTAVSVRVSVTSAEQLNRLDRLLETGRKYAVSTDSGYASLYTAVAAEIDSSLAVLDTLSRGAPEAERVADLLSLWRAFQSEATEAVGADVPPVPLLANAVDDMKQAVIDVSNAARSSMRTEMGRATRDQSRALTSALIVGAAALLAGLTIILLIIRSISGSLSRLSTATKRVAEGEFDHRLDSAHDEEFRELARNFDAMVSRLGEVDQLKRNFLSGISHDLKSPLASIKDALQLLLDEVPGPVNEKQERIMRLGLASGDRLSSMISDLLMLAQLESQVVEYQFRPTDLADITRQAVERLESRLAQAGVVAELEAPESLVVDCDEARVSQVIENLLDNALKFSPSGSTLSVEVASSPANGAREEARLMVSDEGPGVPDQDKTAIFERFAQSGEPAGSAGGVGLGLTICREIVAAHDGRITVEDRPGGGSTFLVSLPARPKEG